MFEIERLQLNESSQGCEQQKILFARVTSVARVFLYRPMRATAVQILLNTLRAVKTLPWNKWCFAKSVTTL